MIARRSSRKMDKSKQYDNSSRSLTVFSFLPYLSLDQQDRLKCVIEAGGRHISEWCILCYRPNFPGVNEGWDSGGRRLRRHPTLQNFLL